MSVDYAYQPVPLASISTPKSLATPPSYDFDDPNQTYLTTPLLSNSSPNTIPQPAPNSPFSPEPKIVESYHSTSDIPLTAEAQVGIESLQTQPKKSFDFWGLGVATAIIASIVYLGISIRLYIQQPIIPVDADALITGRPLAVDFDGFDNIEIRLGFIAAMSLPTFALCWCTKRMHMIASRQLSEEGYLETCVWQCHVSWHSYINYATSTVLVLIICATQAASAAVVAPQLWSDDTDYGVETRRKALGYCPLFMIVHATGYILLCLWAGLCLRYLRLKGATKLGDQFDWKQVSPSPRYSGTLQVQALEYPVVRGKGFSGMKGMNALAVGFTLLSIGLCFVPLGEAKYSGQSILQMLKWNTLNLTGMTLGSTESQTACWKSAAMGFGMLTAIHLAMEVASEPLEVVVSRLWWERLWARRISGKVDSKTVVESYPRWKYRPHLIWLYAGSCVKSWLLNIAVAVGTFRDVAPTYDDEDIYSEYGIGLFLVPCASFILAILILSHSLIVIVNVLYVKIRCKADGYHNFGRKNGCWVAWA